MPNPTRDELKQAAEAMVEAYLSTRYPPEELTLGKTPGYHIARALLSAFEREDAWVPRRSLALGTLRQAHSFVNWMLRSNKGNGAIEHEGEPLLETLKAAIKAAEEGV